MTTVNKLILGPNSWHLAYSALATPATLYPEIVSLILEGGWEFLDSLGAEDRVYRAPMIDAPQVYKYVRVLLTDTVLGLIVYESWNTVTHVGTNLAHLSNNGSYHQRLNFASGGSLFLFISPQWLVAYSRIPEGTGKYIYGSESGSAWTGCFEIEKGNTGETTGEYPRFAWVNGQTFSGEQQIAGAPSAYPTLSSVKAEYHHWSVPRARNGAVGYAASKNCVVSSITVPMIVRVDPTYSQHCQTNTGYSFSASREENEKTPGLLATPSSPWSNVGAPGVSQPYAYDVVSGVRGAFMGLKIVSAASGSIMDTFSIRTGASGKPSIYGSPVAHAVLGNTLGNMRVALPL